MEHHFKHQQNPDYRKQSENSLVSSNKLQENKWWEDLQIKRLEKPINQLQDINLTESSLMIKRIKR